MASNGIQINGTFGKWLGIVVAGLLIAGVGGVWNMNYQIGRMASKIEGIQARLDQVEKIVIYRGPSFGGPGP